MNKESEATEGVKARSVLWYLTFFGFAMNYMIRININIAIVAMISDEFKGKHVVTSECFDMKNASTETFSNISSDEIGLVAKAYVPLEQRFLDLIGVCCDCVCHQFYLLHGCLSTLTG